MRPGGTLVIDLATFVDESRADPDYFLAAQSIESATPDWTRPVAGMELLTRRSRSNRFPSGIEFEFIYEQINGNHVVDTYWRLNDFAHIRYGLGCSASPARDGTSLVYVQLRQ